MMSYKRPFDDVMREFRENFPDEINQLTAEDIAERTGYSVGTVREYLRRLPNIQEWRKQKQEEEQRRAQQTVAYTYNASSGNVRVMYYPLLAEVKIMSTQTRKRFGSWDQEAPSLLLTPQDAIEIGIYLLGLQPHIRDVLARKDKIQDVQEVEYPTQDMIDEEQL